MSKLFSIIRGCIQAAGIKCSSAKSLFDYLCNQIDEHKIGGSTSISLLSNLKAKLLDLNRNTKSFGEKEALRGLVVQDIDEIIDVINQYGEDSFSEDEIGYSSKKIKNVYQKFGFDTDHVVIEVVENFPKPYEKMNFWAMSYDATDTAFHNLTPGVRMKKEHLFPVYSEGMIAHELLHSIIGRKAGKRLARGIEEGFADFIGYIMVSSFNMPIEWCFNIIKNSRLSYPRNTLKLNYTEALRQVMLIYLQKGMPYVLKVAKETQIQGRDYLKEFEQELLSGSIPDISIEEKYYDFAKEFRYEEELKKFATTYIGFPMSLNVTALSYFFAMNLVVGDVFPAFLKDHSIDEEEGNKALDKICGNDVYLVVKGENETISFTEGKVYINSNTLKYKIA